MPNWARRRLSISERTDALTGSTDPNLCGVTSVVKGVVVAMAVAVVAVVFVVVVVVTLAGVVPAYTETY